MTLTRLRLQYRGMRRCANELHLMRPNPNDLIEVSFAYAPIKTDQKLISKFSVPAGGSISRQRVDKHMFQVCAYLHEQDPLSGQPGSRECFYSFLGNANVRILKCRPGYSSRQTGGD